MAEWKMPDEVKLAGVWSVWGFLSLGAWGWGLFVVLDFFDAKADAAAWVQAVGSVAAILVAVWLNERQNTTRLSEAKEFRKDQAHKVLAIAGLVVPRFKHSCLVYKGAPQVVLQRVAQCVKEDAALLRQFDLAHIPTAAITDVWLELITCVFAGEEDLAKLAGIIPADGIERFGLEAAEKTIQEIYDRLEGLVRAYEG